MLSLIHIFLITIAIALGTFSIHTYFNYLPAVKLDQQQKTVTGTVTDLSVSEKGKQVLTVRLDHEIVPTFRPVKIRIFLENSISIRTVSYTHLESADGVRFVRRLPGHW